MRDLANASGWQSDGGSAPGHAIWPRRGQPDASARTHYVIDHYPGRMAFPQAHRRYGIELRHPNFTVPVEKNCVFASSLSAVAGISALLPARRRLGVSARESWQNWVSKFEPGSRGCFYLPKPRQAV